MHSADGSTRAITVTNNIFGGIRWRWNVHRWDHGEGTLVGRANLFAAFGRAGLADVPWSMCARVVGSEVSFKAWPTGGEQPGWADPERTGHVTLPAGWDAPGVPGWFIGHLVPGGSTRFVDPTIWVLVPADEGVPTLVWPPD